MRPVFAVSRGYLPSTARRTLDNMPSSTVTRATPFLWLLPDIAAVLLFVVVGRASHGEGPLGILVTAWPFLAGIAVGWVVARAWRHPLTVRWTGVIVWVSVVVVGMLLRLLIGDGVASSFVFVSFIALGVFIVGWRAAVWVVLALLGRAPGEGEDDPEDV